MASKEMKELLKQEAAINEKINKLAYKKRSAFASKVNDFEEIVHLHCMYRDIDTPPYSDPSWYTIESSIDKTGEHAYINLISNWIVDNVYTTGKEHHVEEVVTKWSRKKLFEWVFRHSNFSELVKRGFTNTKNLRVALIELYGWREETKENEWW